MASFSRLQLAAALIEYDNDPSDPEKPFRSAHESAIFAHLRRIPPLPPQPRRSIDYLSVDLPGDNDSGARADSAMGHSRAPSSTEVLRNPFGRDTIFSDGAPEEGEVDMEVDLASWGLDSFIPKDKSRSSKNSKGKDKVETLPNPHAATQASSYRSVRSLSMGNLDSFGVGDAFLDSASTTALERRRRSLGSALELGEYQQVRHPLLRQRPSSTHDAIYRIPTAPPLHSVPFPAQSVRSASPGPIDGFVGPSRERRMSSASIGSQGLLSDAEEKPNPFVIDPPTPEKASRFDPKARARTMSVATMGSLGSRKVLAEDNPLRPSSPSSRLDPAMLRDPDAASFMSGVPVHRQPIRDRPYSTLELMRPKVLVMPSPLQGQNSVIVHNEPTREGFEITTDGPPLPYGARSNTGRRLSSAGLLGNPSGSAVPIASNSFTPNPRASLTLSQLTFRNTLLVGGQRDVAYTDIDAYLRRATEDGEQIIEEVPEEEPARPVTVVVDEPEGVGRPPGKLYGRSLVDELELRKATMRSKQRVFTGDDRPSMMARGPRRRSTTLIDPTSLNQGPVSQNVLGRSETHPNLDRRGSLGGKPLLNFDAEQLPVLNPSPGGRAARSVFGVDTLWERETAKLKEIEAEEAEQQRQQEAAEAKRSQKKSKKKRKEKAVPQDVPVEEPRVSAAAPVLPVIPRGITKGVPPPPNNDDSESGSGSDTDKPQPPPRISTEGWHSGDSDVEKVGPVRTTGVGPRYPNRSRQRAPATQPVAKPASDDDSEEDIPLAATVGRAVQRATLFGLPAAELSDSDEEKPLSQLLTRSKLLDVPPLDADPPSASTALSGAVDDGDDDGDDDDDKPLGLRVSRFASSQSQLGHVLVEDDEDDRPLAFHPEQQRRTQYNMLLQQQQQQLILQAQIQQAQIQQAQIQQSMMFSTPSLMGSAFFGAPTLPQVVPLMPPAPASPPPGAQDMAKFGRVDRWRREIVGGQP